MTHSSSLIYLGRDSPAYPSSLRDYLGARAPMRLAALGNTELLHAGALALFCSRKCPGDLILKTYDLARNLRERGETVISGFHSPPEQEALNLLLAGSSGRAIICPARSLERMRVPARWSAPLAEGRLLVLSPFGEGHARQTARFAHKRNEFVAALASPILIIHAAPNGTTEEFARQFVAWGKPLLTLPADGNSNLLALGAITFTVPP